MSVIPPLTKQDHKKIAKGRLKDAEVLLANNRYDSAIYLCGYAVESILKARICHTLKWTEYKISREYQSFKTHDLAVLLNLSGSESRIKPTYLAQWSIVTTWESGIRYYPVGSKSSQQAIDMIDSTKIILGALWFK